MTANYYETLGISQSATAQEIRRAYRILARRYHPDVNPQGASEDRFKQIAQAYAILSDEDKRRNYDLEISTQQHSSRVSRQADSSSHRRARQRYAEAQARARAFSEGAKTRRNKPVDSEPQEAPGAARIRRATAAPQNERTAHFDFLSDIGGSIKRGVSSLKNILGSGSESTHADSAGDVRQRPPEFLSILEVSISMRDAILGGRKSFEVPFPEGMTKVSVNIPPGVRSGYLLRARSRASDPRRRGQELVFVLKVAPHPSLEIQPKGLIIEVPITVSEAIGGANINVPTLDEPVNLKIPPGAQSGTELRLKSRGIIQASGERGDLFYRLMIMIPRHYEAPGIKESAASLEQYYGDSVRQALPRNIIDMI